MPAKSKKGGSYERDVCKRLSLWWSGGRDDDLFWRTSGSGGRATVRGRKGKRTTGHCGDVGATCPESEPLIQLITWEIKRGYNNYTGPTIGDVLDKPPSIQVPHAFEDFLTQTIAASKRAGTPHWALILRRDYRDEVVFIDKDLYDELYTGLRLAEPPIIRADLKLVGIGKVVRIVGMRLDAFLSCVFPTDIKELANELANSKGRV